MGGEQAVSGIAAGGKVTASLQPLGNEGEQRGHADARDTNSPLVKSSSWYFERQSEACGQSTTTVPFGRT